MTEKIMAAEIMLIEDNEGDVELMVEAMQECKITNPVRVVRDGAEALDYLYKRGSFANAKRPDLIFLDLNLPKVNGRDVLRTIKEDPDLKSIPVIVMTTSSAEEDVIRSYDLHANCYVKKPVDWEQFHKIVLSLINVWFTIVTLPTIGGERNVR